MSVFITFTTIEMTFHISGNQLFTSGPKRCH